MAEERSAPFEELLDDTLFIRPLARTSSDEVP
jgi:hypothetical protein